MIELVTLRVHATGLARNPPVVTLSPGETPAPSEYTDVLIGGETVSVPVIERAAMGAGARFAGPVILTQLDTTTFVAPGWAGEVHASGNILMERASA